MTGDGVGSDWLREQIRQRKDPDEKDARRTAVNRRLFGKAAAPEPADEPDDGPDAA